MHFLKLVSCPSGVAYQIALGMITFWSVWTGTLAAAEVPAANKSASGTFVSFKDGTLTIKGKSGLLVYEQVGENYKSYQNNEDGPGSKLVGTIEALSRVLPGTVCHVDTATREVSFGLDNRVMGTFVSYEKEKGKLHLLAADVPQGFVQRPIGKIALTIDRSTPVLESRDGGDFKFAGVAEVILKDVKNGALVTARSEYDPEIIEVIQIGTPRRTIERYIGQTRGTVRGTYMSFKDGILRIRGKGVTSLAANEYERSMNLRIADNIPVFESIDGGEYQPRGTAEVLKTLKEGEVVTIRKVEEVIMDIRIGVPKTK